MVKTDALQDCASSRFGLSRRLTTPLKQGLQGWRELGTVDQQNWETFLSFYDEGNGFWELPPLLEL